MSPVGSNETTTKSVMTTQTSNADATISSHDYLSSNQPDVTETNEISHFKEETYSAADANDFNVTQNNYSESVTETNASLNK